MFSITHIKAREILDSRGFPTMLCTVTLSDGAQGTAAVPSGASTGSQEALELRDQDTKRYLGKGVLKAIANIHREIAPALCQGKAFDQTSLDAFIIALDGTANKSRLGANALLAVSLAFAHAAAKAQNLPLYEHLALPHPRYLPTPLVNVFNGGAHANNGLAVQECMIVPAGFSSFSEALRAASEIFHALKSLLKQKKMSVAVGDEGGFAPQVSDTRQALDWLMQAVEDAGYTLQKHIFLALDVAASEFYRDDQYRLDEKQVLSREAWVKTLISWCDQYPIISVEDGMAENDDMGWRALSDALNTRVQLVGDDLFVTNPKLLQAGIQAGIANSILIKLNQIGTVSETLRTIEMAHGASYAPVISHRSGETEDTSIADLAVATGAMQIKTGSLCRSERTAKYNRLLAISEETGLSFSGMRPFEKFLKKPSG